MVATRTQVSEGRGQVRLRAARTSVLVLAVVGLAASVAACGGGTPPTSAVAATTTSTISPELEGDPGGGGNGGGGGVVTDEPEVQITFCVENTIDQADIVDGARQSIPTFLRELARPGGDRLAPDREMPAIGVTVRPITATSYDEDAVVKVVLPARPAEPNVLEADESGGVSLDDIEANDAAMNLAKDTRDDAEAYAANAIGAFDLASFGKASAVQELWGCSGRAAEDFSTLPKDGHGILVMVTSGVSGEVARPPRDLSRLAGDGAGHDVTAYVMLQCDGVDPRSGETNGEPNELCARASTAVSTFASLNGLTPTTDDDAGADAFIYEEGASGDWDALLARLLRLKTLASKEPA